MITCIYHAGCPDGFTAAHIVASYFGQQLVSLVEGRYGEPPPPLDVDERVYIVDFSYPRDELLRLANSVAYVTVFDHHQSAQQDLEGVSHPKLRVVFDMERSGAGITWDELYACERSPLVDHIEDRDLWRFRYPDTPAVFAAVTSREQTLDEWDQLNWSTLAELVAEGTAIARYRQRLVEAALEGRARVRIGGHEVWAANAPYAVGSDVAGELAVGEPFAAYWYDHGDERRWGLRSDPDGLDVAEIAKLYGGGGHKHASGFRTAPPQVEPL